MDSTPASSSRPSRTTPAASPRGGRRRRPGPRRARRHRGEGARERAVACEVIDLREEFLEDFAFPMAISGRSTRAATCSAPRSPPTHRPPGGVRPSTRLRHAPTAAPARGTTRSASRPPSRGAPDLQVIAMAALGDPEPRGRAPTTSPPAASCSASRRRSGRGTRTSAHQPRGRRPRGSLERAADRRLDPDGRSPRPGGSGQRDHRVREGHARLARRRAAPVPSSSDSTNWAAPTGSDASTSSRTGWWA